MKSQIPAATNNGVRIRHHLRNFGDAGPFNGALRRDQLEKFQLNRRTAISTRPRTGVIKALADPSCTSFVTPQIIPVLYIASSLLVLAGLTFMVLVGFEDSQRYGFAALLISPIAGFIALLLVRTVFEKAIVQFTIAEELQMQRERRP